MNNISKSRRAFFLQGGAALSAGVATAAVAAPASRSPPLNDDLRTLQQQLALAEDREAIRKVHLAFIGQIENQTYSPASGKPAILRVRANHLQQQDTLSVSDDALQATATWHVDAAVGSPLLGDSTVAQMARMQGQVADHHWESGRFHARYAKTHGQWRLETVDYQA